MSTTNYVWHDININPQERPSIETNVLVMTNKGHYYVANYWDGVFVIPNKNKDEKVIRWKYFEPYAYEKGNCETCTHCIPCKQLVEGEWKGFKICNLFANEPDGWCIVVTDDGTCESFFRKGNR